MKKIFIVFFLTIVLFGKSFANIADHNANLATLINSGRWIEAKEYLNDNRDNINEFMILVGESMINSFTNNPKGAIDSINVLKEKYGSQLGDQMIQFYGLLLNNYDDLQEYDKSIAICDELMKLEGLPENVINGTIQRKEWCEKMSMIPQLRIHQKKDKDISIKYKTSEIASSIIFNVDCNGQTVSAIFDTGSSTTALSEELAQKIGVRYFFNDTIKLNKNTVNARIGLIDSISIANYTFYNFPVTVLIDSIKKSKNTAIKKAEDSLEEFDMILGMSLLKHIDELHIDTQNGVVKFPSEVSNPIMKAPMQLVNNLLYLRISLNDTRYTGLLDTGLDMNLLINDSYYKQHQHIFQVNDTIVEKNILRYNNIEKLNGKVTKPVKVEIVNSTNQLIKAMILLESKNNYDGIIGDFILKDSKYIRFNFKEMWLAIELI